MKKITRYKIDWWNEFEWTLLLLNWREAFAMLALLSAPFLVLLLPMPAKVEQPPEETLWHYRVTQCHLFLENGWVTEGRVFAANEWDAFEKAYGEVPQNNNLSSYRTQVWKYYQNAPPVVRCRGE